MKGTSSSRIGYAGGVVVAVTFIVAALGKIADPAALAEQTANYQLLPSLSNYVAAALPGIELVCAGALIVGNQRWRQGAALALAVLLAVFTAAIVRAWALGLDLECGCFGVGSSRVGPWPVLRNAALLCLLAVAWWFGRRSPGPLEPEVETAS